MPFDSIKELNKQYEFDKYYQFFFDYKELPPTYIVQYIIEYLNLPYKELKKYGFTIGLGAPDKEYKQRSQRYTSRLSEKLRQAITFCSRQDLSIFKIVIDVLHKSNIIDNLPPHEAYILREEVYSIYRKFNKLTDPYPHMKIIEDIDDLYTAWFMKIDKILSDNPTYKYTYIWEPKEFQKKLGPRLQEFNAIIDANREYRQPVQIDDSDNHFTDKIVQYIRNLNKQILFNFGLCITKLLTKQQIIVKEHLTAILYSILIKEFLGHIEMADVSERPFWIRESIRTFKPWLMKANAPNDPSTFMIYPTITSNIIRQIIRRQISVLDWQEMVVKMIRTKTPIFETDDWRRLIEYGRELYDAEPVAEMQHSYNKPFRKQANRELKGIIPVEVHGTINNSALPVIIYGEIHNQIDNGFYKHHSFDQREDMTIWVEHNATTCGLKDGEDAMFRYAKGNEWVWYRRVKNGLPVRCIDIRIQKGLPHALFEDAMRHIVGLDILYTDSAHIRLRDQIIKQNNLETISVLLRVIKKHIDIYSALNIDMMVIQHIYLKYRKVIRKQYSILQHMLKTEKHETELFYEYLKSIITNMIRLHSIIVDGHIIHLLKSYNDSKPIALFVGLNHAFRLAHFLNWDIVPNEYDEQESNAMETLSPLEVKESIRSPVRSLRGSPQVSVRRSPVNEYIEAEQNTRKSKKSLTKTLKKSRN